MLAGKIRADITRPKGLRGMKEQLSSKELQTFVLLAHSPSFTVAAQTLHVTQSALSKRIAELENKLGVRLFDRTTRQLDLTMEGREFLAMAISLLEHMERSVTELRQMANGERGKLWMTAAPNISSTLIAPVLAAYSKANPHVGITYYDCRREEMLRHIGAGSAEFGIIGGIIGQDHGFPPDFQVTRIVERLEHMAVGFAPGHPLGDLETVRWQDLMPYKLVMLRTSGGLGHMYRIVSQNLQVSLPSAIEVSMTNTAIGMAASGIGIVVFPSYVIDNVYGPNLHNRRIEGSELQYEFCFLHLKGRSLSGAAMAFGAVLREFFS